MGLINIVFFKINVYNKEILIILILNDKLF